jgi:hypothetical protein
LRDELLNGEIFYSLKEAQAVIEHWRRSGRPEATFTTQPAAMRKIK